jgi:hypothetical protein
MVGHRADMGEVLLVFDASLRRYGCDFLGAGIMPMPAHNLRGRCWARGLR